MGRRHEIAKIKNASNYSESEIVELLSLAHNAWEYDFIIDKLYFYNKGFDDILKARQELYRRRKEVGFQKGEDG